MCPVEAWHGFEQPLSPGGHGRAMKTNSADPKRPRLSGRERLWQEIQSYLEFWTIATEPL